MDFLRRFAGSCNEITSPFNKIQCNIMNPMKQPVNFRLENDKIAALDRLAKSLDRDRSYLLTEAVNSYLELHEWQIEQIQEGIREADAGRLIDHDIVVKRMRKKMQRRRTHR